MARDHSHDSNLPSVPDTGARSSAPDAHDHAHDHSHDHSHDDEHDHGHEHEHDTGLLGRLREAIPFLHGHSHGEVSVDAALEGSARGIWALKISLAILGATALFQVVIAVMSGSVGLLADTIHNIADALTALPLWVAFVIGRRPPNRGYTYGYGRAEDIAGVVIVLIIFISAAVAAYETLQKLLHPEPLTAVGWVMLAAIVGFIGNEAVAVLRIRVGREIGSAALVADGEHARIDGLTSLAVLIGAVGSWLGFPLADPLVGLGITVAILFIARDAAVVMWRRLMDAVDPSLVDGVERVAARTPGVQEVHDVRIRWIGHRLYAELHVTVDEDLTTRQAHDIAETVRHELLHDQPRLSVVNVHVDPCGHNGGDPHNMTAHHAQPGRL
ncbi:MAG: cation diffusion facilitator family transporter [Anaerolineae bacterium]